MSEAQSKTAKDDEQNQTVNLDIQLAVDALIAAWKEDGGRSHVLALDHDGLTDETYLEWEVRPNSLDSDCIRASNVLDNYYIEDGLVVDYDIPDTLTIGGETFDVHV